MTADPTAALGQPGNRDVRRGIGRVEVVIVLIGLATIAAFIVATSMMSNRLQARKLQVQANHVLQVKVSLANLRLEQALSGQAQVLTGTSPGGPFPDRQGARQPDAVDVDQEIHGNLADAIVLCRARLDGGPSPIGDVPAASGRQVRANLEALCREVGLLRDLANTRLAQGAAPSATPEAVQQYERHFREILRLAGEDSRALDDASARDEAIRLRTTELTIGALAALFVGLAVVVWRNRRAITRKNVELSQLASIVGCANDAVLSVNLDGQILSWNRGAQQLYGYTSEEAIGLSVLQLIPEDRRDEALGTLRAVGEGTSLDGYESASLRQDGTTVDVSLTISPLRDAAGAVVGAAVIGRDVSARRQAEKAQAEAHDAAVEASRLKSEFLANMSHEIRTPINGVTGLVGLLLDTDLDASQRRYAEGAREAATTLLGIINDILDFSKIEAGKIELEEVDVDLQGLVEGVAGLLAVPAHAKGLELACQYEPAVPTALRGDPLRLRQVLLNLLSNAVKFTDEGEVVLRAESLEEDDESVLVRFEVRDTGVGIPPGDRARLFDAFSQADASTTRRFGGTGLGLAVSKRLVELMGGEIGVDSELGRGSTFWFTVRLPKQPAASKAAPSDQPLDGLPVLVVDDNPTQRTILDQHLRAWGMRPVLAAGAEEAVKLAAGGGERFRLAIVDLEMPGVSGLEAIRRMHEIDTYEDLAVILLSPTGRVDAETARDAGLTAVVAKPPRQSELHDAIVNAMTPAPAGGAITQGEPGGVSPGLSADGGCLGPVLVVEDNVQNQIVAAGLVEALGYRVDVATNGYEALEALERGEYALVLMDCQMPEMDGYEATAEIRRRQAVGRRVPIIAMTANAMAGDREACLAAGMDDYVSKPIDRRTLAEVMARWHGPTRETETGAPVEDGATSSDAHAGGERGGTSRGEVLDPAGRQQIIDSFGTDGDAVFDQLVDVFLRDAPALVEAIPAGRERGRLTDARRAAHTLKANAASLGATALASLCQEAESAARRGSGEDLDHLIPQIEAAFEETQEALRSLHRSAAEP